MSWWQVLCSAGVPSLLVSLFMVFFNKKLNKREESIEAREKRVENFLLAILSSQRSTNTLATATAKAVQRIPDAKCNGDMKSALDEAMKCQAQENDLLMQLGVSALNK